MICRQLIARWTWLVQHCPYARLTVTWVVNDTDKAGLSRHLNTVFILEPFFVVLRARPGCVARSLSFMAETLPSNRISLSWLCPDVSHHRSRVASWLEVGETDIPVYWWGGRGWSRMRTLLSMILPFFYVYDRLSIYHQLIYIHLHSHRPLKAILALSRLLLLLLLRGAVFRFFPTICIITTAWSGLYSTSRDKMRRAIF